MKYAVRYYTKSGNTEKLAKEIARVLGVEALDVSVPLSEDVEILFLGSSVYAAGVDETIKTFIKKIDVNVGSVVNFSTAAIIRSTYKQVKQLLGAKNIKVQDENFYCKGSFGPMHKGRPNEADLKNVAEFAIQFKR